MYYYYPSPSRLPILPLEISTAISPIKLDIAFSFYKCSQPRDLVCALHQLSVEVAMSRPINHITHWTAIRLSLISVEEAKFTTIISAIALPKPPQIKKERREREREKESNKKNSPISLPLVNLIRKPNPIRTCTLADAQRDQRIDGQNGTIQHIPGKNKRLVSAVLLVVLGHVLPPLDGLVGGNVRTHDVNIQVGGKAVYGDRGDEAGVGWGRQGGGVVDDDGGVGVQIGVDAGEERGDGRGVGEVGG